MILGVCSGRALAEPESLAYVDLRAQPVALIFGIYRAALDVGLADRLAIGPNFAYFPTGRNNTIDINAYQAGVTATYFLLDGRFQHGVRRSPVRKGVGDRQRWRERIIRARASTDVCPSEAAVVRDQR